MHVDILFHQTKVIPIMFKRVTTYYQTLKTWIGHNATRYHTFNALPHALSHVLLYIFSHNAICYHNFSVLPHTLPYISSQCSMVWSYLQRVTTRYCQIYKEIYINIFLKKMMVTLGNALQIAQNQENHRGNIR